jgi:hypothetical protein
MPDAPHRTLSFLKSVSAWFESREGADFAMPCSRHQIEHTGKAVYAAAIDLVLLRETGDKRYEDRIRKRTLRTLSMVRADPKSGASVFFPGSLDSRNAASNLIDSGACCDVLAEVLAEVPHLFSDSERTMIADAVNRVCQTYLVKAVLVKEIPAQRLWGATGLARAARTFDNAEYARIAKEAVRVAMRQSNADGSIPYMPEPDKHGEHVGLADITTFYHSRHLGFALYIYRCLEEEPDDEVKAWLRKGYDFLVAIYGRDGIKPLVNEAKQWYWESPYEVASHNFDVQALVEGARVFGDERLAFYARLSLDQLFAHVAPDGGVVSHHGDEINFQCRDFWNGHVAWIARVWKQIPDQVAEPEPRGVLVYEDSGIVRIERRDWVAILRGKKQPINISFGGDVGGGSLLYFGRRDDGWKDRVKIPKWSSQAPGNFAVTPFKRPSFKQRVMAFYRDNRHDVRFRLYIANVERKAGNTRHSFEYPLRHVVLKLRDEMKGRYASHFDVAPSMSLEDNAVVYSSMMARRDGALLRGSTVHRRYTVGEMQLEVEDTLTLDLPVRAVIYEKIEGCRDFRVEGETPSRVNHSTIMFQPEKYPARIRITYQL